MKLSTRSTYGMRALVELALSPGHGPLSAAVIAQRQHLSLAYLEQLLHRLKRQGLVTSIRGPKGGYVLAKDPQQITMADVVEVLDGLDGAPYQNGREVVRRALWNPTSKPGGRHPERVPRLRSGLVPSSVEARGPAAKAIARVEGANGRSGTKASRAAGVEAPQRAESIRQAVWRCVHERLVQSLSEVTLRDICDEVGSAAGEPLDHRYVFHI